MELTRAWRGQGDTYRTYVQRQAFAAHMRIFAHAPHPTTHNTVHIQLACIVFHWTDYRLSKL